MNQKYEAPPSPFIASINNRDEFNSLINPDLDDEDDQRANTLLKDVLPDNINISTTQQRLLAEQCMLKSRVDCSALINQCMFMLTMPPDYECQDNNTMEWKKCGQEYICDPMTHLPFKDVIYRIDPTDPESLDNWYTTLNLECQSKNVVELFNISFLIGLVLGTIIFSRVGDLLGRKKTYFIGLLMHVLLSATLLILRDPNYFYAIIFLMGIEYPARFLVGYIYLSEMCSEKSRPIVTSIALFFVAQSVTFACIYFSLISKHWIWLEIVGLIITVIALIGAIWIPESPRFLIAQGKYAKAYRVFQRIAKFNGKKFNKIHFKLTTRRTSDDDELEQAVKDPNAWIERNSMASNQEEDSQMEKDQFTEVNISQESETKSNNKMLKFTDIFLKKQLRTNTIVLLICWLTYQFSTTMLYRSMSLTVDSTFVDYLISANSEAFGYTFAAFIYMNRQNGGKRTIAVGFLASSLISLIFIGFYQQSPQLIACS
eukprot:403360243